MTALAAYLAGQRWFGGKGRAIARAHIDELAPMPGAPAHALTRVTVQFADGDLAAYQLPVALPTEPTLVDAVTSPDFRRALARAFADGAAAESPHLRWIFEPLADLTALPDLPSRVLGGEQSNTSIVFGDLAILKLYRRLEPGLQPDVEVARALTTRAGFRGTPALLGVLHLRGREGDGVAGVLQAYKPGSIDGWSHVLARLATAGVGDATSDLLTEMHALGQQTRALHEALASLTDDPAFAPEPTRDDDLERWRLAARDRLDASSRLLAARLDRLPAATAAAARELLTRAPELRARLDRPLHAVGPRIRHHGDYHLGQVLRTADGDWQIIDFEGEPARPLAERRAKHHPLRDVAGMLRSFAYAAAVATADPDLRARWQRSMRVAFLHGYDPTLTADDGLLALFAAEKLFYELAYELTNRPDWAWIPLAGLAELLA